MKRGAGKKQGATKPRKVGTAARHEVNRAELDPLKQRVAELERVVESLTKQVTRLEEFNGSTV